MLVLVLWILHVLIAHTNTLTNLHTCTCVRCGVVSTMQWCCGSPWAARRRFYRNYYDDSDDSDDSYPYFYDGSDDDDDDDDDLPVRHIRPSYTLDIDRLAVKCMYKTDQGMNDICAICLEEFTEGEQVRELPCLHGEYSIHFTPLV